MSVLTLSIKQKYLDEILAGTKKVETREIRPSNAKDYVSYVVDGVEYEREGDIPDGDSEVTVKAKYYDRLKLVTGEYKGKRPYLIVEVKDSHVEFAFDENGEFIIMEQKGVEYALANIVFELGNILETFKI
jgi:putative sterol carrier protein